MNTAYFLRHNKILQNRTFNNTQSFSSAMNEKTISIFVLLAVLVAGVIGFVEIKKADTGAAMLNMACCCEIKQYDYYGGVIGVQVQRISVSSLQSYNDQSCSNRCDLMFGTGPIIVIGHAC